MNITIEQITGIDIVRKALSFAYEIDSKMTDELLHKRGHTIQRLKLYAIYMEGIPTKVSVHLVRHSSTGQFHMVSSNRADWAGKRWTDDRLIHDAKVCRLTPVNHFMLLNSQHLIDMARSRMCGAAEDDTIKVMRAIKAEIACVDSELARWMVPPCVTTGVCREERMCGRWKMYRSPFTGAVVDRVLHAK